MKRYLWMLTMIFSLLSAQDTFAQRLALSTNTMEYLNLCTFNAEVSCALARKWTADAVLRYNPFQYHKGDVERAFQNKVQAYALGVRYWPWHVYSGWWTSCHLQYQEYSSGHLLSDKVMEGDRYGGSLGFGYSYMLGPHFNVDFGLRVWMGLDDYTRYDCLFCGLTLEKGRSFFVLPDELLISFSYVF